jgi:hypothetical protein
MPTKAQDWDWDNPDNNDASAVRHAPDRDQYHLPDDIMSRQIRPSRVGRFATIPAANANGTSKGFNVNEPSVVHVDPHAPDGGVIFDPAAVSKNDLDRAIAGSNYPHQVYYQLSGAPPLKRGLNHVQEEQPVPPMPQQPPPQPYHQPQVAQQPQPLPQAAPQPYPMMPPPPAYQAQPDMTMQLLAQIAQGMAALQQGMAASQQQQYAPQPPAPRVAPPREERMQTLPPEMRKVRGRGEDEDLSARPIRARRREEDDEEEAPPSPRRTRPSLVEERRQTVKDYDERLAEDAPRDGVITGFETLNLPWLTGPVGTKPRFQVFFDMPSGRVSANFHDVIDSEHNVVLVYDTRYEDGMQYLPPDMNDQPLHITVPRLKKDFLVCSMGFHFQFGAFDMIVLVKPPSEDGFEPAA